MTMERIAVIRRRIASGVLEPISAVELLVLLDAWEALWRKSHGGPEAHDA